ncbi:MAG: hypothetical protein ACLP1X_19170 [Polyangiaceae bacterium]
MVDEVTEGVTWAGHESPCTKSGTFVALAFVLMATMASVAVDGFWKATICTPEGTGPETSTRRYPGRTNLLKLPIV